MCNNKLIIFLSTNQNQLLLCNMLIDVEPEMDRIKNVYLDSMLT